MSDPNATKSNRLSPSQELLRYFAHDHLPEPLKTISSYVRGTALFMEELLPDGPEKTMGLRKLLEAKDCFVRAALPPAPAYPLIEMEGVPRGMHPFSITTPIDSLSVDPEKAEQAVVADLPADIPFETNQVLLLGTEDLIAETARRKAANERAERKAINIVNGQCYGPVFIESPDGGFRAARCYYGLCTWTYKFADGDLDVSQVQHRHNDAGAALVED